MFSHYETVAELLKDLRRYSANAKVRFHTKKKYGMGILSIYADTDDDHQDDKFVETDFVEIDIG